MKRILVIFLLTLVSNFSIAQNFSLTSSEFEIGDVYRAKPLILFELADWTIKQESYNHLDSIASFLVKNDTLMIEIGVHTDSRISDFYSSRLELKRAQSILEYLKEKGVDSTRLVAQGYGKTQLLISDSEIDKMETAREKEEAHAANRRVEFKIVEIRK